jgi:hypothetical protein
MKTKMNISRLKRVAMTAGFAVLLVTALTAQPNPERPASDDLSAIARLDNLMNNTAALIQYNAPEVYATDEFKTVIEKNEVEIALNNLELLANETRQAILYVAPDEEVDNALQSLDLLADAAEKEMVYTVPAEDVEMAVQNLELLVSAAENDLAYHAPFAKDYYSAEPVLEDVNSASEMEMIAVQKTSRPVQVVSYNSNHQANVVKVVYYNNDQPSVWNSIKNLFGRKTAVKHYAAKF